MDEDDAPYYVGQSRLHGTGLHAAKTIPRGARIGTFEGPPAKRDGPHVLWAQDARGAWRARRGRNALRYVNHADKPNAIFLGWDLIALRRIRPDEEITVDYGAGDEDD